MCSDTVSDVVDELEVEELGDSDFERVMLELRDKVGDGVMSLAVDDCVADFDPVLGVWEEVLVGLTVAVEVDVRDKDMLLLRLSVGVWLADSFVDVRVGDTVELKDELELAVTVKLNVLRDEDAVPVSDIEGV